MEEQACAASRRLGLAAGVHVLPHIVWAPAAWNPPAVLGKSAGNPSEKKPQLSNVLPRSNVQESNLSLGQFISGTGLIIAVFAVCWRWTTRQKSWSDIWLWEKLLRKYCQSWRSAYLFLEVCAEYLVMFLCLNVHLSIQLCDHLHDFSFFFLSHSACQLKALDLCLEPTNVFARLDSIIPTSSQWTAFRVSACAWVKKKEHRASINNAGLLFILVRVIQ